MRDEVTGINGSKNKCSQNIEDKHKFNPSPNIEYHSTEITRIVTPLTSIIKKSKSKSVTQFSFRDRLFAAVSLSEDMTVDCQLSEFDAVSEKKILSPSRKIQNENDVHQKQNQYLSNWYISAENSPVGTLVESFGGSNITAGSIYNSAAFYPVPSIMLLRREESVGEANLSDRSSSPFDLLAENGKTDN